MTENVFEIQFKNEAGEWVYHSTEVVEGIEDLRELMSTDLGAEFVRKYSGGWYRFVNIESGETYRARLTDKRRRVEQDDYPLFAKAREATVRYLERNGFDITADNCRKETFDIVANEDGEVVFVKVGVSRDEIVEPSVCRDTWQREVAAYLIANKDAMVNCRIRCDIVAMLVMAPDRAMLRHHRNALGEM